MLLVGFYICRKKHQLIDYSHFPKKKWNERKHTDFSVQEKVLELQETNTRLTGQLKENRYVNLRGHFAIMSLWRRLSSVCNPNRPTKHPYFLAIKPVAGFSLYHQSPSIVFLVWPTFFHPQCPCCFKIFYWCMHHLVPKLCSLGEKTSSLEKERQPWNRCRFHSFIICW